MSFRLKTILGIAAIEVLLLTVLVVSSLQHLRTSNQEQMLQRAHTTGRLLAAVTSDAVVAMDLATLDAIVQNTIGTRGIDYVRVRARNGAVLSEGGRSEALKRDFVADDEANPDDGDHRIDLAEQITVAGRTFGTIEIGISTAALEATIADATRWLLSVAGLEIVLVGIFGYVLGRILTEQLSALQVGARRVAEGNFGYQISVRGKDELADTARSFNRMSRALADYAGDLESARKVAEDGRLKAESVLQDAVESLSQGIVITDTNARILMCNTAFTRLYPDAKASLAEAQTLRDISAAVKPLIDSVSDDSADRYRAQKDYTAAPHRWTSHLTDGRHILHTRRPMNTGGWVFAETDVTAIYEAQEKARRLERDLLQAQKLESLGTLAGGIAHEINTPIQYIGDNLRFLQESTQDLLAVIDVYGNLAAAAEEQGLLADRVQECRRALEEREVDFLRDETAQAAAQSIDGVHQVANIVLAMKEFSHPSRKERTPVDINRVFERSAMVCKSEWKHVAEIDFDLASDLPEINGLEGSLNQVALNMLVNAAHAIAAKGDGLGHITVSTARAGDNVQIKITDNGTGMPDDVRDRIFEPFFTTKGVGRGTGQGLALAHDIIVNKHGGRIDVVTMPGRGTTFTIYLPCGQMAQAA